jgi:hypothetical protein
VSHHIAQVGLELMILFPQQPSREEEVCAIIPGFMFYRCLFGRCTDFLYQSEFDQRSRNTISNRISFLIAGYYREFVGIGAQVIVGAGGKVKVNFLPPCCASSARCK